MTEIIQRMYTVVIGLTIVLMSFTSIQPQSLWESVKKEKTALTLSVWFTAQDVNKYLLNPAGLNDAVSWCKQHGVTKVYLEAFGRGNQTIQG